MALLPSNDASSRTRAAFAGAARALVDLVARLGDDDWDLPGLGEWTVRDLTGHASRALSTVESYVATPGTEPVDLDDAGAYYRAIRGPLTDSAAVTQRGRDAGRALGPDPAHTVGALAQRVLTLVGTTADDRVLATPFGTIRLIDYLATRTFELTVHSLDLARATGFEPPDTLLGLPVRESLLLAAAMAADLPAAGDILLLLTGRTGLPPGLSAV